jgi:hypothetical protein
MKFQEQLLLLFYEDKQEVVQLLADAAMVEQIKEFGMLPGSQLEQHYIQL